VLTVAWISDFPVEWLSDLPGPVRDLPRQKPATWAAVLLAEFERNPALKIHVFALRKNIPNDFHFERNGVSFHLIKVPGGMRAPSLFWVDTLAIRRAMKPYRPDLVHAWGTERGAGLVASRLKRPFVVTIQGLLTWYREIVPVNAYERFAARTESWSLHRARNVTTESSFAVGFLAKRHPHLHIRQAEHASNWVFHRISRQPQQASLRLLTVGDIGPRKGTDLLLRALETLRRETPCELVVVGHPSDSFLAPLRRELPSALWDCVTFKEGLTQSEVADELARATLFVLPTRADTSPNAVKEAAVAAVPVVATRIGGIPDYIFAGKNGLLCASNDLAGLVQVLREARVHPLFGKGRVDSATLSWVRNYLSPTTMAKTFWSFYDEASQR
jgi:glycosyltransferase involved in cell wall biosynthesis